MTISPERNKLLLQRYKLQFFSFPKIWNDCDVIKLNPNANIFTKSVKSALINALVV